MKHLYILYAVYSILYILRRARKSDKKYNRLHLGALKIKRMILVDRMVREEKNTVNETMREELPNLFVWRRPGIYFGKM